LDTAELRGAVEDLLSRHFARRCRIARFEHRRCPFRTCSPIEEIDLALDDGTSLRMLLKDLSQEGLLEGAGRTKPAFLHDPLREIEIYRTLLAEYRLGTPLCYGAITNESVGRFWLLLERVPGLELYQVGEFAAWQHVARWLAAFHSRLASEAVPSARTAHLLKYDGDYYRLWLRRALDFVPAQRQDRRGLERLAAGYDRVIERLLALPATIIHGELYASNVLMQETADGLRVCPVDWEMAGIGPGLIDLAALTAGNWKEAEKDALALAYHAEATRAPIASAAEAQLGIAEADAFRSALDHCRLQCAVQWLGWSPSWSPPREHRQDWLREALRLADRIGLS
jgi:Ser/Thr protein kinase RdoA (MazF antagonist)